jgi:hypothetical protein
MNGPRCSCYVDNCRTARDRFLRPVTTVVECPKHSTPALRELLERGREAKRAYGIGRKVA